MADHLDGMDGIHDGMEDVETPPAAARIVVDVNGEVEFGYSPSVYTAPTGESIQCIVVAAVSNRYLAVFPNSVWRRQPTKGAACPVPCEAGLLGGGLLSPFDSRRGCRRSNHESVGGLHHGGELRCDERECGCGPSVNYAFTANGSHEYLPYAQSLFDVLQDHYAFFSAESGNGQPADGSGSAGRNPLEARVTSLEGLMEKMSGNLEEVLGAVRHRARSSSSPAPPRVKLNPEAQDMAALPQSGLNKKKLKSAASEKYPTLNPAVVAAAMGAGVSETSLVEMQRLMAAGQTGQKKLREPALRTSAKKPAFEVLSESEDEEEDDSGFQEPSSPPSMEAAVTKLTELVSLLSAERVKKAKASKIDLALESISGTSSTDAGGGSQLKRAAAARRALRQALQDSPEEISAVVEKLLHEDLTAQVQAPGMPMPSFNARAWVEHRSRISAAYKTAAYSSWSIAGVLDNLVKGRYAHARAQAGLLLLQLDQVAIDKGSWSLAAELALEQGPPLAALANERWREPLLEAARSTMVRGDACPFEGCGRLPSETQNPGKKVSDRRAWKRAPWEAEAKTEGQEQGSGRAKRCMTKSSRRHADGPSGSVVEGDTKTVIIPGAHAPSVKVPGLLNSMLRLMTQYTFKLSGFLASFLRNVPKPPTEATSLGPLWPMPVPYPEVFGLSSAFRSSWRKRRLVLQVVTLNWLYLGRPAVCPPDLWPGQRPSARQWRRIKLLEDLSEDGNSIFEVDPQLMGRAALKTESSADQLDSLHRASLGRLCMVVHPTVDVLVRLPLGCVKMVLRSLADWMGCMAAFRGNWMVKRLLLLDRFKLTVFSLLEALSLTRSPFSMLRLQRPTSTLWSADVQTRPSKFPESVCTPQRLREMSCTERWLKVAGLFQWLKMKWMVNFSVGSFVSPRTLNVIGSYLMLDLLTLQSLSCQLGPGPWRLLRPWLAWNWARMRAC